MDYSTFIAERGQEVQRFFYEKCGMTMTHIAKIDPTGGRDLWMWTKPRESAFFFLWLMKLATVLEINSGGNQPNADQIIAMAIGFLAPQRAAEKGGEEFPPHMQNPAPAPVSSPALHTPAPVAPSPTTSAPPRVSVAEVMAGAHPSGGHVKDIGLPSFNIEGKINPGMSVRPATEGGVIVDNRTGKVTER